LAIPRIELSCLPEKLVLKSLSLTSPNSDFSNAEGALLPEFDVGDVKVIVLPLISAGDLIELVLSRFSSGYLIANLAIKESDHGTTIR